MRQILNISLPMSMINTIKEEVKEGGFASVSEFIRHLIRQHNTQKLLSEIEAARKEYREGKAIELKSFDELDKL